MKFLKRFIPDFRPVKIEELKIFITRNMETTPEEFWNIKKKGAALFGFSTIKIVPVEDYAPLKEIIRSVSKFDYILFTSVNAIKYFFYGKEKSDFVYDFDQTKILAVGKKSKSYFEKKFRTEIEIPDTFTGSALADKLIKEGIKGKKVLIPGSAIASKELPEKLKAAGASVYTVPVYDNIIPENGLLEQQIKTLNEFNPNMYIFTSPSSFRNFLQLLNVDNTKEYFSGKHLVAIGSITKTEIENYDLKVNLIPHEFTLESVANTIIEKYS